MQPHLHPNRSTDCQEPFIEAGASEKKSGLSKLTKRILDKNKRLSLACYNIARRLRDVFMKPDVTDQMIMKVEVGYFHDFKDLPMDTKEKIHSAVKRLYPSENGHLSLNTQMNKSRIWYCFVEELGKIA